MPQVVTGQASKQILRGVAITAMIFATAVTIPVFGAFGILMVPLPVLYYRLKLGRQSGGIVPVAAFLLWWVILGEMSVDLFIFMEQLVLGFVLGELLERQLSLEKTIGYATGIVLLTGGGALLFYTAAMGIGIGDFISNHIAANLAMYQEVYKNMGAPDEKMQSVSTAFDYAQYVLVRILPGLCAAAALFDAWVCLVLARPLLKARQLMTLDVGPFNRWKAPEPLVWGIIGFGLMMLVSNAAFKLTGINGLIVLLQIYFFQGIAIVSFYFEKKKMPGILRWFLYSLIALQVYVLALVIGLGFFDMWLDFRRLKQPTETNGVS